MFMNVSDTVLFTIGKIWKPLIYKHLVSGITIVSRSTPEWYDFIVEFICIELGKYTLTTEFGVKLVGLVKFNVYLLNDPTLVTYDASTILEIDMI